MRRIVPLAVVAGLLTAFLSVGGVASAESASNSWAHVVVGGFSTPDGAGHWLVYADGTVTTNGDAHDYGNAAHLALNRPIVGGAATLDGRGYWLVASDGGVFTYGDARFSGSMGATPLNQPVFSIVPTKTGLGYWLVAHDGGVFAFGDARFFGSGANRDHAYPVEGFATSPSGTGYQQITRDALLLNFGTFPLPPYLPGRGFDHAVDDIVGIAPTPTKLGYWIVEANGGLFAFGDAHPFGRPTFSGVVRAVFSNPKAQGFLLISTSGALIPVGTAPG